VSPELVVEDEALDWGMVAVTTVVFPASVTETGLVVNEFNESLSSIPESADITDVDPVEISDVWVVIWVVFERVVVVVNVLSTVAKWDWGATPMPLSPEAWSLTET
jgi:hypothetical protein